MDKTKKGNKDGSNACRHNVSPSFAPQRAVLASRISSRKPMPEKIPTAVFFFNVHHLGRIYAVMCKNITGKTYAFHKGGSRMKKRKNLVEHLALATQLHDEAVPGLPLIEIVGDKRVLIEEHCGVTEYGLRQITVNVKFGRVLILGNDLQLALMTKEKLVICGQIEAVQLIRREN